MPFDAFIKIDGIPGESLDSQHKDEIELLSFSFGVVQQGGRRPRPDLQDFNFTKNFDTASPRLLEVSCAGDHLKDAVISIRKAGEKPQDYIKITLQEVLVSQVSAGGAPGGSSSSPTEEVALSFARIEMEVRRQLPDGSLGGSVVSDCAARGGRSGIAAAADDDRDSRR